MINNINSPYPLGTGEKGIRPSNLGANISRDTKTDDPEKLMEMCREFESVFINLILKQARSGINVGEVEEKSHAREIFEEMQDENMAISMAQGDGVGLAQHLYKQLSAASNRIVYKEEVNVDSVDKNTENVDRDLDNIKNVDSIE